MIAGAARPPHCGDGVLIQIKFFAPQQWYAAPMRKNNEHLPGDAAPTTGGYEELNVFGTRTGKLILVTEGDALPRAPRGFTWRPLDQRSASELQQAVVEYRRLAATATTADIRDALLRLAVEFDALAVDKERSQ